MWFDFINPDESSWKGDTSAMDELDYCLNQVTVLSQRDFKLGTVFFPPEAGELASLFARLAAGLQKLICGSWI